MSKYRPSRTSAGVHFSGLHNDSEPSERCQDDNETRMRKKSEKKRARKARKKGR